MSLITDGNYVHFGQTDRKNRPLWVKVLYPSPLYPKFTVYCKKLFFETWSQFLKSSSLSVAWIQCHFKGANSYLSRRIYNLHHTHTGICKASIWNFSLSNRASDLLIDGSIKSGRMDILRLKVIVIFVPLESISTSELDIDLGPREISNGITWKRKWRNIIIVRICVFAQSRRSVDQCLC